MMMVVMVVVVTAVVTGHETDQVHIPVGINMIIV